MCYRYASRRRWSCTLSAATLSIGLLLVVLATVLVSEMKDLLISRTAKPETRAAIERSELDSPDVLQLIHLRTQHLGPEKLLLGAKLHSRDDLTMTKLVCRIGAAEQRVRAVVPFAYPVFTAPDISGPFTPTDEPSRS